MKPGVRLIEVDGSEFAAVANRDSIDFYFGRKVISTFAMSSTNAFRLAWWLVWHYIVLGAWFGARIRIGRIRMVRKLKLQALRFK